MNNLNNSIEKIRHFSRQMVRELGMLSVTPHGLPPSFCHALVELNLHGTLNQIELAALLKLDKSTISRIIKKLLKEDLVTLAPTTSDQRHKPLLLTTLGKKIVEEINTTSNQQVHDALLQLSTIEQEKVVLGIELYAKALKRARQLATIEIKPYTDEYKNQIIQLILHIQTAEFNIPVSITDQPDLENIKNIYQKNKGNFWVALDNNKVIGTIAMIDIGNAQCALRKMFVAKEYRGKDRGLSQQLLNTLLAWCKKHTIQEVYLGTVDILRAAHRFYEKNGFVEIPKATLPKNFPIMPIDTKFYSYYIK